MPHLNKQEEKEQIKAYRVVKLPHIRTTVYFMDLSQLKGIEIKGSAYTCVFGNDPQKIEIGVFFEKIKKRVKKKELFPWFAHEIQHVIQIICEQIMSTPQEEKEHMAYITTYLLEELLKPDNKKVEL